MLEQLISASHQIPFNQMLGLKVDHLSPHDANLNFTMKKELIGNFMQHILHGGVISSVLDMAGGMVIMAAVTDKYQDKPKEDVIAIIAKCSTIDLQVSFHRPGKGDLFIAKAELIKLGNKISFTKMTLYNEKDQLIASASGTYANG